MNQNSHACTNCVLLSGGFNGPELLNTHSLKTNTFLLTTLRSKDMQLEAVVKDNPGVLSHHLAKHKGNKTEKKKREKNTVWFHKRGKGLKKKNGLKRKVDPWSQGFSFTQQYEERKVWREKKMASKEGLGPWPRRVFIYSAV